VKVEDKQAALSPDHDQERWTSAKIGITPSYPIIVIVLSLRDIHHGELKFH
jgi:hypothetical protein